MMKVLDIASFVTRSFFAALNLQLAFEISTPSKRLLQRLSLADGDDTHSRYVSWGSLLKAFVFGYLMLEGLLMSDYVTASLKVKERIQNFKDVVSRNVKKGLTQSQDVKRYQDMSYEVWKGHEAHRQHLQHARLPLVSGHHHQSGFVQ
ncbi:hypothetical protein MRX96_005088 [Rhipicephalus microplus]